MRTGFTLIEVIIAVAILSVAAMAVFNLGLQSSRISAVLEQREALMGPLSIAALHGNADHHNMNRTLERLIDAEYNIEHEGLRRHLQQTQITYRQRVLEQVELMPGMEEMGWDLPRFELIERQVQMGESALRILSIEVER